MSRFFKALATKNINKNCAAQKRNAIWIFSVDHLYPWRVAPQQSSIPFPGGAAKLKSDLYIYNLS